MLEMEGESAEKWGDFVTSLKLIFILLKEDEEDSLFWLGNEKNGIYTVKLGYLVLAAEGIFRRQESGGGSIFGNRRHP
jgi:hypothetical protein